MFDKYCKEVKPFLRKVKSYTESVWGDAIQYSCYRNSTDSFSDSNRFQFVGEFGWAIPCDEAIQTILDLNIPILSVGSGRAYWEFCLKRAGANITATDSVVGVGQYSGASPKTWMPVAQKNALEAISGNMGNTALMMVWASYNDDWSGLCLQKYIKNGGKYLIWVGEGVGGCTGDALCHYIMNNQMKKLKRVDIPQWDGLHDSLTIYGVE